MMAFDPFLAEMRFGCGLSPVIAPSDSAAMMLEGVLGPDKMAATYSVEHFDRFRLRLVENHRLQKELNANKDTKLADQTRKARNLGRRQTREDGLGWLRQSMLRRANTDTGFRERLAFFWADHFTAKGKRGAFNRSSQHLG